VARAEQARDAVERVAVVVAVAQLGGASVQRHSDLQRAGCAPGFGGERALGGQTSCERIHSGGEGCMERVTDGLEHNPALRLDMGQRRELVRTLSAELGESRAPSCRELAACCVYWAVSCAAYFSAVLADSPNASQHSPEVPVLATEPLLHAAEFWNGEL